MCFAPAGKCRPGNSPLLFSTLTYIPSLCRPTGEEISPGGSLVSSTGSLPCKRSASSSESGEGRSLQHQDEHWKADLACTLPSLANDSHGDMNRTSQRQSPGMLRHSGPCLKYHFVHHWEIYIHLQTDLDICLLSLSRDLDCCIELQAITENQRKHAWCCTMLSLKTKTKEPKTACLQRA